MHFGICKNIIRNCLNDDLITSFNINTDEWRKDLLLYRKNNIAGYNYGADNFKRVKETINKSILYATSLAILVFIIIMVFPSQIVRVFTNDVAIIQQTPNALRIVFAVTPLIAIQLIGSSFFQSIGKAKPALFLSLSKQGFFLIPLILILPNYFGLMGVWASFPIADALSTALTFYYLRREMRLNMNESSSK